MREGLKVFVVTCDKCGEKQIWNDDRVANDCDSCDSLLVKKTISDLDLKKVKSYPEAASITFSDYQVYSIYPEDVERIREHNRAVKREEFEKKKNAILAKRKLYARA